MPRSGSRGPGSPNPRASRCASSTPCEPMWPTPRRANHEPESSRGPMGPNRSAHPGARIPARTRNPLHIAFAPDEPGKCGVTCCTRRPASQQFLRRKNHVAARIVVRSKGPESACGKWARIAARTMLPLPRRSRASAGSPAATFGLPARHSSTAEAMWLSKSSCGPMCPNRRKVRGGRIVARAM